MPATTEAFRSAGAYSLVSAMMLGSAPPNPSPVMKRIAPSENKVSANTIANDAAATRVTDKRSTGLRPYRSPARPEATAPTRSSEEPDAEDGAEGCGFQMELRGDPGSGQGDGLGVESVHHGHDCADQMIQTWILVTRRPWRNNSELVDSNVPPH